MLYYLVCSLAPNDVWLEAIHRLVAHAWLPPPVDALATVVNHLNRDKTDNRHANLQGTTFEANTVHALARQVVVTLEGEERAGLF